MDDRDEDEKRRVMTPPREWNGDQDDDSDSDWLSGTDSEPEEQGNDDTPERPEVDDAGWLTAEDAPPEPVFAPAESDGPEADWFSEGGSDAAPEQKPSARQDAPDNNPTQPAATAASPEKTPASAKTGESIDFSSEDLLTDHQIVSTGSAGRLPLWPTLGGAVAVVLLIVGGWGAISERTALQQRIAELEQRPSTPRPSGDLDAQAEAELAAENSALQMQLSSLRDQYNVANSLISDLQAELDASAEAAATTAAATTVAAEVKTVAEAAADTVVEDTRPAPVAVAQPLASDSDSDSNPQSNEVATGEWFVNVAAYSKSTTAESLRDKLLGQGFNAITQTVASGDRTLHRVRVVGFSSQSAAKAAATDLEASYNTGPLWVGKDSSAPLVQPLDALDAKVEPSAPKAEPVPAAEPPATTGTGSGGWFIYVDTYAQGLEADKKARQIEDAGYSAKVAVEYRSNELFYRVQIVGIDSRERGEDIIDSLAARGDMPNLQLRQY